MRLPPSHFVTGQSRIDLNEHSAVETEPRIAVAA
jgi:hypothetical protein